MDTEQRIAQFLRDHPTGTLRVAVGFASIWGLAWLHRHTQGRRVDLLIDNTQKKRFIVESSDEDRQAALDFLRRGDVTIRNYFDHQYHRATRAKSDAHLKAWLVVEGGVNYLLVGSANLTKQGLRHNVEVMVEATGADLGISVQKINDLYRDDRSTDCRGRLEGYIREDWPSPESAPTPRHKPTHQHTPRQPRSTSGTSGGKRRTAKDEPSQMVKYIVFAIMAIVFLAWVLPWVFDRLFSNPSSNEPVSPAVPVVSVPATVAPQNPAPATTAASAAGPVATTAVAAPQPPATTLSAEEIFVRGRLPGCATCA